MTAALALSRQLGDLLEFSRIGFVNILAFRLRYYTGIVTYLINVTVYYFIWKALYATDPDFAAGFTFAEMVTYVSVGWVIRSVYFNNIDQNISYEVMEGKIALSLLKPVSVQTMQMGRALGESAFRLVMLTIPAGIVISLVFSSARAGKRTALRVLLDLARREHLADGCFELHRRHVRHSHEVDPGLAARQVLCLRAIVGTARSDDNVPRHFAEDRRLFAFSAHRIYTVAPLSRQA